MILLDAQRLTEKLMNQHNLNEMGWRFEFDNSKRRFGCCNYTHKKITLSRHLVLLNDETRVTNTILHEIAHALVGSGHGHDNVWRRKAIQIGCDGKRCYTEKNTVTPAAKYVAICKGCGAEAKRQRKPQRTSSCGRCSNRFNPNTILEFVQQY